MGNNYVHIMRLLFFIVLIDISTTTSVESKTLDERFLREMKEELAELKSNLGEVTAELGKVKGQLKEVTDENHQLKQHMYIDLERVKHNSQADVFRLQRQLNSINNYLTDRISNMKDSPNVNTIASFTAYVTTGDNLYQAGSTIMFDSVVNNYGGFYNPALGGFTCPVTGYYLFTTTINPGYGSGRRVGVEIQLADVGLVDTYAGAYSPASAIIVTFCEMFQQVSVRATFDDSYVYGTESRRWSTFTGTLLFESTEWDNKLVK